MELYVLLSFGNQWENVSNYRSYSLACYLRSLAIVVAMCVISLTMTIPYVVGRMLHYGVILSAASDAAIPKEMITDHFK